MLNINFFKALEDCPSWPDDVSEDQIQELFETAIGTIIFHLSDTIIILINKKDEPTKIWNKFDELFQKKIIVD